MFSGHKDADDKSEKYSWPANMSTRRPPWCYNEALSSSMFSGHKDADDKSDKYSSKAPIFSSANMTFNGQNI